MCACVSIIGKDNSPLYIATASADKEIELQYQVHASLDVIEEKCSTGQKQSADGRELYLGLLNSTEIYKIYGYVTNTKVKFVIVIDSSNTSFRENEVRSMFRNLHSLYTDAVCNPFYIPGEPLTSKTFDINSFARARTKTMSSIPYELLVPSGLLTVSIYALRWYKIRKWGWVTNNSSLKGKLFIITGANTGLGYETTKALTARQATTIMACRNISKANEAIEKIRQNTKEGLLIPMELDLASFQSIREFASEIKHRYPDFHCLINNAGLAAQKPEFTQEGFEVHFGVNHLGQFLLVDLLKENLKKNNSRVVVVSSRMHEIEASVDIDNLGKWIDYDSRLNRLYNNSKLMNFYFARELYKRGFNVHVLCPGLCHTDFFRHYDPKWYHYLMFSPIVWLMLRSAEQGAQNIIYSATDSITDEKRNPVTGYFVSNVKMRKSNFPFDEEISVRLWNESVEAIEESSRSS